MKQRLPFTYLLFLILAYASCSCHKDPTPVPEQLAAPTLDYFYTEADTVGATVTIVGRHFSKQQQNNTVSFHGVEAVAFRSSSDTLKVRVPIGATTGLLQVKVYTQTVTSTYPFTVLTGRWKHSPDCPGPGRFDGIGFAIGNKCYIGTGTGDNYNKDFWEYDVSTKRWTRKADFAGGLRREAISFVLNGKGYVGFGTNTTTFTLAPEFYEYDPSTGQWTRRADIPSYATGNAVGLAVNGRGYVITGGYSKQVLEYNPLTDAWTNKRDFPGQARSQAAGFVLGTKAYVGGGNSGGNPSLLDFWEYDPALDQWTRKADLIATCIEGVGFDLNGKGYLGVGYHSTKELDEYDLALDKWTYKTNHAGPGWNGAVAFSAAGKGYVANGITLNNNVSNQLWSFTP
jgi:N-acetylneuraminic acid mutarotase